MQHEEFNTTAKAVLMVQIGDAEPKVATEEDLAQFGYYKEATSSEEESPSIDEETDSTIQKPGDKFRQNLREFAEKNPEYMKALYESMGILDIVRGRFFGTLFKNNPEFTAYYASMVQNAYRPEYFANFWKGMFPDTGKIFTSTVSEERKDFPHYQPVPFTVFEDLHKGCRACCKCQDVT